MSWATPRTWQGEPSPFALEDQFAAKEPMPIAVGMSQAVFKFKYIPILRLVIAFGVFQITQPIVRMHEHL
jgi:hypothetical protein